MHVTSKIDEFASYGVQTCTFISAALHLTLWKLFVYEKTIVCITTTATVILSTYSSALLYVLYCATTLCIAKC